MIQKNLQPLLEHTEKKKRAQEAYYEKTENEMGISPMIRNSKAPVRQRLGRKIAFNGTNTAAIPPKKRLYKVNPTLNNSIRKQRVVKRNLAQMRLNKIRERHRLQLSQSNLNNSAPKRLRKLGPVSNMLRVEVRNNNAHIVNNQLVNQVPGRHRQVLDSTLQAEIRELQSLHQSVEMFFNVRFKPVTTAIPIGDRFSHLF